MVVLMSVGDIFRLQRRQCICMELSILSGKLKTFEGGGNTLCTQNNIKKTNNTNTQTPTTAFPLALLLCPPKCRSGFDLPSAFLFLDSNFLLE